MKKIVDIQAIKNKILPLLRKYDVKKASFFGSFVNGRMNQKSDIDILVVFKGKKSLLDLSGLKIELEELLRRKVDVVTYSSLHPILKERILSQQESIL